MSKIWQFKGLLTNNGWLTPAYVTTNKAGRILEISKIKPHKDDPLEMVEGYAIPGFQNAHSHAFQYTMSGLAEIHPDPLSTDDFWSWRDTMYNIALSINPDQMEHIATMLYCEMLEHGYTDVAEFHYVHHDKDGKPYAQRSEMGARLISAAKTAGIGITLVPIFYQKGTFGQPPVEKQRRFISPGPHEYLELLEAAGQAANAYDKARIGLGIHSLRAVEKDAIETVLRQAGHWPIHIHVAEQLKEVSDCLAYYGQRPVEWLLHHFDVNENFHLVHATHLTPSEVTSLARSGAHVVLCPSTEGNLGDGIFPLYDFQSQGGQWSLGTDSHIGINPLEEIRILDYGQRLTTHRRNQMVSATNGNAGLFGIDMALRAGRKAMGNPDELYFAPGQSLDAVIIDAQVPLIATSKAQNLLSTLVYSGDKTFMLGTLIQGEWKVKEGRHMDRDAVVSNFKKSLAELRIR